jgi:hypothetical protein
MSHLDEEKKIVDRNLGDEWIDWDGKNEGSPSAGKGLFLASAYAVILAVDLIAFFLVYMISPRLSLWAGWLPFVAWFVAISFGVISFVWLTQMTLTILSSRDLITLKSCIWILLDIIFAGIFRLASLFGISKDKMGNSFITAYNEISRATKPKGRKEKLLILLPRCLTKEQLKEITGLKDVYPINIHVVSGGELARKKVKELRPTAVIGVACERDLISGIRDVGKKISLIGIPNQRPEGPCKNTIIDMKELIEAIEFYVGPPAK